MLRNFGGESYVRRLLAIGAVAVAILAAFALGLGSDLPRVSAAPANPIPVIELGPVAPTALGCKLGPAFGFCEQVPGTTGPNAQFSVSFSAAANSVAVSLAPIAGFPANFAAGDFTITSNTCTGNFAAAQSCNFAVAFSPTTTGLREAAIDITDAASDSLAINIQGTGSQLALTPPPVISGCGSIAPNANAFWYCPENIGVVSTAQQFTLATGSGATGVNVSLQPIAGLESEFAASDFTVETTTCTGALGPNGTCAVDVAFTPTVAGMRSAALTATDSNGDSTTIYLEGPTASGIGFGTALTFGYSSNSTAPCALAKLFSYCNTPVGGIYPAKTYQLQNISGTQVTGLSVPTGSVIAQGATAPDFAVQSSSCTSVLASGASCNVTVAFTPTASGLRQGTVVITDAQGDIGTLNLAGVGDNYSIATQLPTELSAIPGGTATFNATLTPDNILGMNGEQVTFSCPTNLPTNTSCAVAPCPATITPGAPVSVTMALVTSSALIVAPVPAAGCSSYGPSSAEMIGAPPAERPGPPSAGPTLAARGSPFYPALLVLAGFGAIGLLVAAFAMPGNGASRRRVLLLACAGLTVAILAGCHHHKATVTTATPTGTTALTFQGAALDANGNPLNAARSFSATLDVVTK
ncbi:MAG: choice-of-anchor D domain-containing protein [Candidatus Acidiferrales bacterium]